MTYDASLARRVVFWDGTSPEFDAAILMTVYMASDTLEEAVHSIFAQEMRDNVRVQLIMGVDPSTDGSLELSHNLAKSAPDWLHVEVFANELPNLSIGGRQTARSNFLNCYTRIRAPFLASLDCDDAWLTPTKLQSQIDHFHQTGRASCTSLKTEATPLEEANAQKDVQNPFQFGNHVLFSSIAMPYFKPKSGRLLWTIPFLDFFMICIYWERFGIDRLTDEVTFYRVGSGGSWSSQNALKKFRLIRTAVFQMIILGPFSLRHKWLLWKWLEEQWRWIRSQKHLYNDN